MSDPKSPRELLLARHAPAARQLDALRRAAIAGHDSPAAIHLSLPALLLVLFRPQRHAWRVLAVIWLGLLAFHFTLGRPNPPAHPPSAEVIAEWLAQQQSHDLVAKIDH